MIYVKNQVCDRLPDSFFSKKHKYISQ